MSAAKSSVRCFECRASVTKRVAVPSGVTANVEGQTVKVKGPKGAMQLVLHDDVMVTMDKGAFKIEPRGEASARARCGALRARWSPI